MIQDQMEEQQINEIMLKSANTFGRMIFVSPMPNEQFYMQKRKYRRRPSSSSSSFLGSTAQLRPWPPPQNPVEFLGGF
jgi:hypothetical protein